VRFTLVTSIILIISALAFAAQKDVTKLYNTANSQYKSEEYEQALENYMKAIELGGCDFRLFFNIGNTYFRMGDIGRAILWFERARVLSPNDPDIKKNLEFARKLTRDRIESIYAGTLLQPFFRILANISFSNFWIILLIISIAASLASIYAIIRLSGRWLAVVLWILLIISTSFWYIKGNSLWERSLAIVIAPKVDVRSAPSSNSELLFTIHDGTRVGIKETRMGWERIILEDGNSGWVPRQTIEMIIKHNLLSKTNVTDISE